MNDARLSDLDELRKRTSSKWRRFAPDVLPMHVAEMDYEIADNIKDLLVSKVAASDLGYTGPVPEAVEGFISFAESRWGWRVDPRQVRFSPDVGVSAVEILRALGSPGDKVVINSPVYSSFFGWVQEVGLEILDSPLIPAEPQWQLDLTDLERAFSSGAKFYLLCHPHNPLGKLFTEGELMQIAELASKYNVLVISDEIHGPLTYEDQKFIPYLTVSDAARQTGVCITSASKAFNLAGLKAALIISDSKKIQDRLSKLPTALHWRSGFLGAHAMAEAFANSGEWLDSINKLNQVSRNYLTALIKQHLPTVSYWVPESGYLAWIDVSSLEIGKNPASIILETQRVAFVPGQDLGAGYEQYLRINFACHHESIERAVRAIAAAAG